LARFALAIGLQTRPGTLASRAPSWRGTKYKERIMPDAIDRFVNAIAQAAIPTAGAFAADAVLDATVPHWRFTVSGAANVEAELARWFADPGRFEELILTRLPDGALLEFVLAWEEDGEPHMAHQAHRLTMRDGLIASDTAWCGGRWGAALQAEMAEAAADA
jgi:hypothetical protein